MEYYSAIKKNEILPFMTTWMDLEILILSEVSQTEKKKSWSHLYVESKKDKLIKQSRMVISRGWARWRQEWEDVGQRVNNSSYKTIKFWRSNVQHGDCHQWYCIIHLNFAKRVDLKCSHHKKRRPSENDIPGRGNSMCKGTDRAYNNEHDWNVEGVCVWGRGGSRW